jgi:6-phosphogluconolactonase
MYIGVGVGSCRFCANTITGLPQAATISGMSAELIVLDDEHAAARAVGELLADTARQGGPIALSGGKTPEHAYETAAELQPDWTGVELWWSDERCVPPDDHRSNFGLAKRTLLDRLAEAPAAVHRIRGEIRAKEAAAEYDEKLRGVRFALNLLGVGPDGHTASLFPDAAGLDEIQRLAIAAEPALEPLVPRVTLTPPALANADLVLFLAAGASKAEAVARAFASPPSRSTPASMIRARDGRTVAILDRAAASLLQA